MTRPNYSGMPGVSTSYARAATFAAGLGVCDDSDVRVLAWPSILIATTNAGKVREILAALDGLPTTWLTLADVPGMPEPDETGQTFEENAWIKARAYADAARLPTVAEDSGLAIDALGGRPGVLSARYPGATYADKFQNLYLELTPHAQPWTAQFVGALAFAVPPDLTRPAFASVGRVAGTIVRAPRGSNGFGYDPIFEYDGRRTGGELSDAEKLALSHRGRAFREFRRWLERSATG